MNFRSWLEGYEDEILPRSVTVHGKVVNTRHELDSAMAAGSREYQNWDMQVDPNYSKLKRLSMKVMPRESERFQFWGVSRDPVWQMIVRPLFKPTVTEEELRAAVDKLKKLKIMKVPKEEEEEKDYFHLTNQEEPVVNRP
jgi:hypothetical protein